MAYRIDRKVVDDDILPELQRDSINNAFKYLETCKQAPTSTENEQLQQIYFHNFKYEISALKKKIEKAKNEIEKLESLEENMKKKFEEIKELNEKSIKEQKYGKTARSRSRSRSRSKPRSRSRSRDREEEEIEKKAMKDCAASKGRSGLDGPSLRRFWDRQPNKDHFLEKAREKKAKTANSTGGKTQKKKCRHNRRLTQINR